MEGRGGYGSSAGENFISLGSDSGSNPSHNNQWRRGRRPAHQMQRISGTQRSHKSFDEGHNQYQPSFRGGWNQNQRGSNYRGSHQPYHQRRGGNPREGGFGQRGFRHQGPRFPAVEQDISSYYHPSMMEDPWSELETLLKLPDSDVVSSSSQNKATDLGEGLKDSDQESINSDGSED